MNNFTIMWFFFISRKEERYYELLMSIKANHTQIHTRVSSPPHSSHILFLNTPGYDSPLLAWAFQVPFWCLNPLGTHFPIFLKTNSKITYSKESPITKLNPNQFSFCLSNWKNVSVNECVYVCVCPTVVTSHVSSVSQQDPGIKGICHFSTSPAPAGNLCAAQ